ncbi:MAG: UPF0175 family protein [Nanoarchaeota archaeon]
MTAETITTRLPKELITELSEASAVEHLGKSEVLRRLLVQGMQQWRIHKALELYQTRAFSFGQATRFAKVSVWKFSDLLLEHHVPLQLDAEELEHEFRGAGWS